MSWPPPAPKTDGWEKWAPQPKVVAGLATVTITALVLVFLRTVGVDIPDLEGIGGLLAGGALFGGAAYAKKG